MIYANEQQACAAYEQWSLEPDPNGYKETYPEWLDLDESTRELWYRIATSVLNSCAVYAK